MTQNPTTKVIQVIQVGFCRGKGTEQDPSRIVMAYYTLEGVFLAEDDPCLNHWKE